MTPEKIRELIAQGEGLNIEFKSCTEEISSSVYETVCSFLNRAGGHILMGVADDGSIIGVNGTKASTLLSTFITTLNNGNKISPSVFVNADIIDIDEKKIIYAHIQEGEATYCLGKKYFDRNKDTDLDITDKPALLSSLFLRKSKDFSEGRIIPFLQVEDLDDKTFILCRNTVSLKNPTHTWINMSDEEILNSLGLFKIDPVTGIKGLTLAALLLFGKEESIASFYPIYRIEAIYRNCSYNDYTSDNHTYAGRYDDRLTIRTNLISAYQYLIEFTIKYLPDKFFMLEGESQRTDLRIFIFREIIANILVHREYSNPMAGMFEIFSERVRTNNWNRISTLSKKGIIDIDELVNCTKNPNITKTFQRLGWVEELGSGIRNIKKYAPLYYSRSKIVITNEEIFIFDMTYHTPTVNLEKKHHVSVIKDGDNICQNSDDNLKASVKKEEGGVKIEGASVKIEGTSVKIEEGGVKKENKSSELAAMRLPSNLEKALQDKSGGMATKNLKRISQTIEIIYQEIKITRPSLCTKLERSNTQIKNDLIQLQQWGLVSMSKTDNTYFIVSDYLHQE